MKNLKIATRNSTLALWQANHVKSLLLAEHKNLKCEIVPFVTQGDRDKKLPLKFMGGKRVFVKELELALIERRADIAVHSMKDVPAVLPDELEISAIAPRHNPCDAFISNKYGHLSELPDRANIGSSSMRRLRQIGLLYPKLSFSDIRGNIETRLKKLDSGKYDAIILAVAGVERLGLRERIRQIISENECVPATGQGAIGIEIRKDLDEIKQLVAPINDKDTFTCVSAERRVALELDANCDLPIGIFASVSGDNFSLQVFMSDGDGEKIIKESISGSYKNISAITKQLLATLRKRGSKEILIRRSG
ncbi:MAG: hydroxymethylbilane synthase [Pseudomonadota bacterium]|nr:hydroxymethylbilane synthase [Pseudomonadota bacterium]